MCKFVCKGNMPFTRLLQCDIIRLVHGDVAQLGERGNRTAEVRSSILLISTRVYPLYLCVASRFVARNALQSTNRYGILLAKK